MVEDGGTRIVVIPVHHPIVQLRIIGFGMPILAELYMNSQRKECIWILKNGTNSRNARRVIDMKCQLELSPTSVSSCRYGLVGNSDRHMVILQNIAFIVGYRNKYRVAITPNELLGDGWCDIGVGDANTALTIKTIRSTSIVGIVERSIHKFDGKVQRNRSIRTIMVLNRTCSKGAGCH